MPVTYMHEMHNQYNGSFIGVCTGRSCFQYMYTTKFVIAKCICASIKFMSTEHAYTCTCIIVHFTLHAFVDMFVSLLEFWNYLY